MRFSRVEPSYTSGGCRLVWSGGDDGDDPAVILSGAELDKLVEILRGDSAGNIDLEDHASSILVNSDVTQFSLRDRLYEADTAELQEKILEYAKVEHAPRRLSAKSKEFYPSGTGGSKRSGGPSKSVSLHEAILGAGGGADPQNIFSVMARRRSVRKFAKEKVEDWKVDKMLAAADTAPTAGNFQGFQVFYIRNKEMKEALIEAANNQPYVNAPVVLVFCMDPSRVKMKFPPNILEKFSLQDATLAAAYSQLAASAVGLSSIWIGMIDEERVRHIIGTELVPSSILCAGYPARKRPPKTRRNLKEIIRVIE